MDKERRTEEDSSKSWEQIKKYTSYESKIISFKIGKQTYKIYKETLESAFSIAKSKNEFDDRVKNAEELKTSLNLKIKDLKPEKQFISNEDNNEEPEFLKSKLYSFSTELEEKEYEINTLKTENMILQVKFKEMDSSKKEEKLYN
ncbi:hypothetical protein BpHYR1_011709 [Brachionus plicatilis]|uniref:Uncharacterized protein n=1 Tax=Brachionus plicatilis TaxID=10195 RepID=A0A3M7Q8E2_BRAPC|nr:hypothetical protein BpHYR1_011709 [Brachionus plicatilis]